MDELRDIEEELRTHTSVLELGCGTGRLGRRMLRLGLQVAGVDESAEMLACMPRAAERVQSSIEILNLSRRWPAVLLASHMINHPDPEVRMAFVKAARRHTAAKGVFYVRRHDEVWLESIEDGPVGNRSGVAILVENVSRHCGVVSMTLRYKINDSEWTQTFSAAVLNEQEVGALLRSGGYSHVRWLGRNKLWAAAVAGDA